MGVIAKIQRIFGAGVEHRFNHPDFGEFIYDGSAWRTTESSDLLISFYSPRQAPDERLLRLARKVWSRLDELEKSARGFVEASAPSYVENLGKLGGVDFLFPDKTWLRQERAVVPDLSTNDAIFSLTFGLRGDRNVLEVVFAFEKPVHVNYT